MINWIAPRKLAAKRKYSMATDPSPTKSQTAMRTMFLAMHTPNADNTVLPATV